MCCPLLFLRHDSFRSVQVCANKPLAYPGIGKYSSPVSVSYLLQTWKGFGATPAHPVV